MNVLETMKQAIEALEFCKEEVIRYNGRFTVEDASRAAITNLRAAIAEMEKAQPVAIIEQLWAIIDDIDTYGDMAKSDDKAFRAMVERRQKDRWKTGITTDGYTLTIPTHPAPAVPEKQEPVATTRSDPLKNSDLVARLRDEAEELYVPLTLGDLHKEAANEIEYLTNRLRTRCNEVTQLKDELDEWKDAYDKATEAGLNALATTHPAPAVPEGEKCVWTLDNTDCFYHTSCDNAFVLNDGTPAENDMKFCPYCGKTIKEEVEQPWEDEEGEK